jgi:microcystin-dependent protein
MSQPFVGQLALGGWNFAPAGWQTCDGSLLAISEFETLFNLIGTTYGGDGQNTFAVPDLRGRVPVHQGTAATGTSYTLGQTGGVESVTLTSNQIPVHAHPLHADGGNATSPFASGNTPAAVTQNIYHQGAPSATSMNAQACGVVGGSQPHTNVQPYLTLYWVISLFGIFPSQN